MNGVTVAELPPLEASRARSASRTTIEGFPSARPLASGPGDVQHRVHHGSQVICVLASTSPRRIEHRLQQVAVLVGQVTWDDMLLHGDERAPSAQSGHTNETTGVRLASTSNLTRR